jgi:hypothetical protein
MAQDPKFKPQYHQKKKKNTAPYGPGSMQIFLEKRSLI